MEIYKLTNKIMSRTLHEYHIEYRALLPTPGLWAQLKDPCTGPYNVVDVHSNGTVTINGHVHKRINIKRV
jgi:hypothetical protein